MEGIRRVAPEESRYVARELRNHSDEIRKVFLAALLHDVGTILVEDILVNEEGRDRRRTNNKRAAVPSATFAGGSDRGITALHANSVRSASRGRV